jgi:hypothetical protein
MWAQVEDNNIIQVFTRPKALTIGDINYPSNIFTIWSAEELEAIGIYEVVIDNTNLKDKEYYKNTEQTFSFSDGTVNASYGTATAEDLDILNINKEAGGILSETDWYRIREADGGTAVPSNVSTHRTAVRTKANAMCTQIDDAADVDALAALYKYTNTGTEEEPVFTRPLGEFPELD